MKKHRQNCINCGKGMLVFANEVVRFCKKKCAIAHTVKQGLKWDAKMWKPRKKKHWTFEEKMKYAESIK